MAVVGEGVAGVRGSGGAGAEPSDASHSGWFGWFGCTTVVPATAHRPVPFTHFYVSVTAGGKRKDRRNTNRLKKAGGLTGRDRTGRTESDQLGRQTSGQGTARHGTAPHSISQHGHEHAHAC